MVDDEAPVTLSVAAYNPQTGVAPDMEGGAVRVTFEAGELRVSGDAAGLRDLARYCLALADQRAPDGVHVHMDPGVTPLLDDSLPPVVDREGNIEAGRG